MATYWGGGHLILPSQLCQSYLYKSKNVIPEEDIPVGARYRARKSLNEHVRGYKTIKKGLKDKLHEIDHDRKCAHYTLSERHEMAEHNVNNAHHHIEFRRPTNFFFAPTYSPLKSPLFKYHVQVNNTEPRKESVLGLLDATKRIARNPSEKILADPNYRRPTAQEILGIPDISSEELRRQRLGIRKSK